MKRSLRTAAIIACILCFASARGWAASPCVQLADNWSQDFVVLLAQDIDIDSGALRALAPELSNAQGQRAVQNLTPFCRVVAMARPSPESNILIEVWLPDSSMWNGKFLGTGNGGFAGSISTGALAGGLRLGYAVANTDLGTFPAATLGYDAGNGRPEAVRDWGYRGTHAMTVFGKQLVQRYYGRPQSKAYFNGCSTGGHQALMEAQRFPEDYDAILEGAPGHNRTHLHTAFLARSIDADAPGASIPPALLQVYKDRMLAACVGKDGGAPSDAFFTDPTQCRFGPREMLCKPGADPAACLTEAQVRLLERSYDGTRNPRTHEIIYPAWTKGSENAVFTQSPQPRANYVLARWVFGVSWDPSSFDFDRQMDQLDARLAPDINANDPDLSRFAARGGKLIMFHGWSDYIGSPLDSITYFDRISGGSVKKADFVRLFMAPGMEHCGGGPGPNSFGQDLQRPRDEKTQDPSTDLMIALDAWATAGRVPETVIASKRDSDGRVSATRPLCAYPRIAKYDGKGDPGNAASFRCVSGKGAIFTPPAARYLQ